MKRIFDFFKKIFKSIFPKNLLGRFILIVLMPLIALQIVAGYIFFDTHWSLISRRLAENITSQIKILVSIHEEFPNTIQSQKMLSDMDKSFYFDFYFTPFQKIDFEGIDAQETNIVRQFKKTLNQTGYSFLIQDVIGQKEVLVYIQTKNGVLKVVIPQKRLFSSTTYVFILWMICTSVLLFFVAFLFMKNQVRSVIRLANAAEKFGLGLTVDHFKPEGASEVRQAGQSFLLMRRRVLKYISERTAMLSGVSHDLRTPLTRMKLELSMMKTPEAKDLLEDIDEMDRMLNGYLAFIAGEGKEVASKIESSKVVKKIIKKMQKQGQKIDYHIEQKQDIYVRENDFIRAITNILTNCQRYAKHCFLKMFVREDMLVIMVDDDGPGIPEDKREDVFKAFYRLEDSRNKTTGGLGLGLSITRDIISSFGGSISLKDSPKGGLRVVIEIPL